MRWWSSTPVSSNLGAKPWWATKGWLMVGASDPALPSRTPAISPTKGQRQVQKLS